MKKIVRYSIGLMLLTISVLCNGLAVKANDCTSVEEAAGILREQMKNREETVIINYKSNTGLKNDIETDILMKALEHTGNPKEGDYLRYQYGSTEVEINSIDRGYQLIYTISYYTNKEQEKVLDAEIKKVLKDLSLEGKDDYQKIRDIYNYICQNVSYDYENLENTEYNLPYTAYGAMVNKTAVCQGYAVLLYRMLLENGIDCRVIGGISRNERHAWNIVKLEDYYYNLDSTWDAGLSKYEWFLKGSKSFEDHVREEEFTTKDFNSLYVMSTTDYGEGLTDKERWDRHVAERFTGGDGSERNPYQISNAEELALLAYNINNCIYGYNEKCYVLTNDIDLSKYEWVPIGFHMSDNCDNYFQGSFDGNGCTISGMKILSEITMDDRCGSYYGLFGCVGRTNISNLNIENSRIELVSTFSQSDFHEFAGIVMVGGMAGSLNGNIYNCEIDIDINVEAKDANLQVGGLAGYLNSGTVSNVAVTGDMSSSTPKGTAVGGVIGEVYESIISKVSYKGKLKSCNDGISKEPENSDMGFVNAIGGIAGYLQRCDGDKDIIVNDCYVMADIYGKSNYVLRAGTVLGDIINTAHKSILVSNTYSSSVIVVNEVVTDYKDKVFYNFIGDDDRICTTENVTVKNCGFFRYDKFCIINDVENESGDVTLKFDLYKLNEIPITELFEGMLAYNENIWDIENGYYPTLKNQEKMKLPAIEECKSVKGSCGDNVYWEYKENGTLIISGNGKMNSYRSPGDEKTTPPWRIYSRGINEIIIEKGVESLGAVCFVDCQFVQKIVIPASIEEIGEAAFIDCFDLKEIYFYGDAPSIISNAFVTVNADVYYFLTSNWPDETKRNYEGQLKWIPVEHEHQFGKEDCCIDCGLSKKEACISIKAVNQSNNIKLSWTKMSAVDGYTIYKKKMNSSSGFVTLKIISDNSVLNYTDKNVSQGEGYIYAVSAYKIIDGKKKYISNVSEVQIFRVKIKAMTNQNGSVKITWTKVPEASGYKVYRKAQGANTYEILKTIKNGNTVTYTDKTKKTLRNGKWSMYKVVPYYNATSDVVLTSNTPTHYYLNRQSINSVTAAKKAFSVKWTKNNSAKGYELWYSTSGSFKNPVKRIYTSNKTVSKKYTGLKTGKKYYVKVRSYKTVNGNKIYSAWSASKSIKTK